MRIEPITETAFDELQAKHEELFEAETSKGTAYFRPASRHELEAAIKKVEDSPIGANVELSLRCVVYPEAAKLKALFQLYPALAAKIARAIVKASEGEESLLAKKPLSGGEPASEI